MTVVPRAAWANASTTSAVRASSIRAEAPFSGSRPAWAALPAKAMRKRPVPLRATLAAPSSEGSSTSTRSWSRAVSSRNPREASVPTSSSGTRSIETRGGCGSRPSSPSTAIPTAIPAFMSNTPGPRARSPSMRKGSAPHEPTGQTVSRWPRSSVPPRPAPTEARSASPRGGQGRTSARTPFARSRSRTKPASALTRVASLDGDSWATRAARSSISRSRPASKSSNPAWATLTSSVSPSIGVTIISFAERRPDRGGR